MFKEIIISLILIVLISLALVYFKFMTVEQVSNTFYFIGGILLNIAKSIGKAIIEGIINILKMVK
jgi:hypothetical protein